MSAVVMQVVNNLPTADPASVPFAKNVVASSTLFLVTFTNVTTEVINGITDTLINTWTQKYDVTVGSFRFEVWKAPNTGGAGANTLSVNFSALTANSRRIWIAEVKDSITLTDGPNNSRNTSVAESPTLGPTLAVSGKGVAFCVISMDAAAPGYGNWNNGFGDMGGGAASRASFKNFDSDHESSLTPSMLMTGTSTGESIIMAFYGSSGGGSAGEHAYVSVG